jgi:hypothetical protein
MKKYSGMRTVDSIVVTVDAAAVDARFDIEVFDDKGFEWSYEGNAPRQLAFAILFDHSQNAEKSRSRVDVFVTSVIANLDNDWTLSSKDIDDALAQSVNAAS